MNNELYQQNIIDHYKNPRNKYELKDPTHSSRGNNPSCGDRLIVYMNIDNSGFVKKVSFDGDGCAISTASASMLTEYIKGKNVDDLKLMTPGDVYNMLGVNISSGRVNCALLAYKAMNDSLIK